MMADRTIKAYVERRLREGGGASLEQIWRDAREAFPHRAPGWNYVRSLARKFDAHEFELESEQ